MRQFALGLGVGAAAALLVWVCVTATPPAAAQFVPPGPGQPAQANPPAAPALPPPIPAAPQPVGTYQVDGNYVLDTRTGDLYQLLWTDRYVKIDGEEYRVAGRWRKVKSGPPG